MTDDAQPDAKQDKSGVNDNDTSPKGGVALSIENLRYRYDRSGDWVVDLPSFSLASGEQALLTGRSGLGKSTLLHLIAGLIDPQEGSVEVGRRRVHAMRGAARDKFRGRRIGMVFQTFHLLSGFSAEENVLTALMFSSEPKREHTRRAKELLSRLGIDRPGAMVDDLSVGQQQRVAVARALACRPNLVLADEPTASLDPEAGSVATELLQSACRAEGAALLCVSHDPALPARFGRVERLEDLRNEQQQPEGATV